MTKQRKLKDLIRARMEKTGERYSTARLRILLSGVGSGGLELHQAAGYLFSPGICRDTGAATNFLRALGVRDSATGEPLSEALVTGLSGGVGFLYMVFEYTGLPPMLSVLMRYDTSADQFVIGGLKRLGLDLEIKETTSAKAAEKSLEEAIGAGCPALCVVDSVTLTDSLMPAMLKGMVPTVVTVTGEQGGELLIDTGSIGPVRVSRHEFAAARAAFKKGKHRMVTLRGNPDLADLAGAINGAIAGTADRYTNAPYKGYASNFGLAGMEKWHRLLTDPKDKKGWAKLFPDNQAACLGLRRAYMGIHHEMTPPGGGRGVYAAFLRQSAEITGNDRYLLAADAFDAAGERWGAIEDAIASCGVLDVASGCGLLDEYGALLDAQQDTRVPAVTDLKGRLDALTASSELDHARALEIYSDLAGMLGEAIKCEKAAHQRLLDALN
ncbi:MAG: DUF4872 domain-containing protein [Phycisphaerales bacterium]|nr:DUF4872 domain-containing protein [Phycisphaerales bacterium]